MKFKILSKANISLLVILLINFIFAVKYLSRVTTLYLPISIIITLFYYLLWHFRFLFNKLASANSIKKLNIVVSMVFIFLAIIIFHFIPQETLIVDRWSVITSFWNNFFNGEYVYFAKSHLGNMPGPMPFYFILAFPFYLIGELGYFSLFGFIVFLLILKYSKIPVYIQTVVLLLLISSIFYLWEVATRSNILLNSSLILFSIVCSLKTFELKNTTTILLNGILIGLLLSTRNVFIIAYIVLFLYLLKFKIISFTEFIKLGFIITITFATTFLPFMINHFSDFLKMNPFIIQSSFLMPATLSAFCIMLTLGTYFFIKHKHDVYFFSGISLLFTISIYIFYQINKNGFYGAIFESSADISYLILCVPFFLYYLAYFYTQPHNK